MDNKLLFIKTTKIINGTDYDAVVALTNELNENDTIDKGFVDNLLVNFITNSEVKFYFVSNLKWLTEPTRSNLMWEFILRETQGHPEKLDTVVEDLIKLLKNNIIISDYLFYKLISICGSYKRFDLLETIESMLKSK